MGAALWRGGTRARRSPGKSFSCARDAREQDSLHAGAQVYRHIPRAEQTLPVELPEYGQHDIVLQSVSTMQFCAQLFPRIGMTTHVLPVPQSVFVVHPLIVPPEQVQVVVSQVPLLPAHWV